MNQKAILVTLLFLLAACAPIGNRNPYTIQIARLDRDYQAGKITATDYYAYRGKLVAQDREWQANMEKVAVRESINTVLQQTSECNAAAETAIREGINQTKISAWQVGQMQKIDTTQCPTDFRETYQRHIDSIERFCRILSEQSAVEDLGPIFVAFGRALGGDTKGTFSELSKVDDRTHERQKNINESIRDIGMTWQNVKLVAIRYGANP
jgi:hypothetical protein